VSSLVLTRPVYDYSAKSILAQNGVDPAFHFRFSRTCGERILDLSLAVTDLEAATAGTIMIQLILPNGDTIMMTLEVSREMLVARVRFLLSDAQYYALAHTTPDVRPLVIPLLRN
jgi:hypothetical protein